MSAGLGTTEQPLRGTMLKNSHLLMTIPQLPPNPSPGLKKKKKNHTSFAEQHLGMRGRIQVSGCDVFLLRL